MRHYSISLAACLLLGAAAASYGETATHAIVPGFDTTADGRNDDGTYTAPSGCPTSGCSGTKVDLGFSLNYFGQSFSQIYVNTNGNITFDSALSEYTPDDLTAVARQVIAPFWADVDTRHPLSGVTRFGQGMFEQHRAFGVTWSDVGFYDGRASKRNSFQLIIVDRSDTGAGNADIIFNYDSIQWETGEASGGIAGLGGDAARAGYASGTLTVGTFYEFLGSGVAGAFLDSNQSTGLIHRSLNSSVPGRFIFYSRNGRISNLTTSGPCPAPGGTIDVPYAGFTLAVRGGTPPYTYQAVLPPGLTFDTTTLRVSGTATTAGIPTIMSIAVTDAEGVTSTYSCANPFHAELQIAGTCPGTIPTGAPFSFAVSASGGDGDYRWSTTPAASWISATPATGGTSVIAGALPEPGPYTVAVNLDDVSGTGRATLSCDITQVGTPVRVTGPCLTGVLGTPLAIPITITGGTGIYPSIVFSGPSWLRASAMAGTAASGAFMLTLTGTPRSSGSFPVSVTVTDAVGVVGVYRCAVVVTSPRINITSPCPPASVQLGASFAYDLSATGSAGAMVWAIGAGELPAGLALKRTGRIFGTPAGPPGMSLFTIVAEDGRDSDSKSCSMTVTAPELRLTSECPGGGTVGVPYGPFPLGASGGLGTASYAFSVNGSLPDGVALTGRAISGTPVKAGSYSFNIQVSSGTQTATSEFCIITIAPPPLELAGSCPATEQHVGMPVSASFTAKDGVPPYSYRFSGPNWMTFSNGSVSGTPKAGSEGAASFTVAVNDSRKSSKSLSCSMVVASAPTSAPVLSGTCPASKQSQGDTVSIPLSITGGQAPFVWKYDGGDPDLSVSGSDAVASLSGALSQQGTFSFSVNVTDSLGRSADPLTCSITVGPPALKITPSAGCPILAATLPFGSQYTQSFAASGGAPPYSWSVSPSDLFSVGARTGPSANVSATLSREGPIPFSVTLSDGGDSAPAVYLCPLTVDPAPIPPISLTAGSAPADLSQGVPVTLGLSSAAPVPLTGHLGITFTPASGSAVAAYREVTFSAGASPLEFAIPVGGSALPSFMVQRGTVAGTIRVEMLDMTAAGGRNVLPSPAPSVDIVVPRSAPGFTASLQDSSGGYDITVTGFSSTRDITGGSIALASASGSSVRGGTIDLGAHNIGQLLASYFADPSRSSGSGHFQFTIHVSVMGDKSAISSVSVTLINSAGSTTVTAH